ncbi:MAG: PRC-barrel domain-containing protein [Halobaculum sp.]
MSTDGTPQEITSLVGREVYSNNGVFVGEVEDVRGDVILINDVVERLKEEESEEAVPQ